MVAATTPDALEGGRRRHGSAGDSGFELKVTDHAVGVVDGRALVLDREDPCGVVAGGAREDDVAAEVDKHAISAGAHQFVNNDVCREALADRTGVDADASR